MGWIRNIFRWLARRKLASANEHVTASLSANVQSLRLDLDARDHTIDSLKREIEQLREGEVDRINSKVDATLEEVFHSAAAPMSQFLTQLHLMEKEDKDVTAASISSVTRRIVRALEDAGLQAVGEIGQRTQFDPSQHSLRGIAAADNSQTVVIRAPAMLWRDRVLKLAIVEVFEE